MRTIFKLFPSLQLNQNMASPFASLSAPERHGLQVGSEGTWRLASALRRHRSGGYVTAAVSHPRLHFKQTLGPVNVMSKAGSISPMRNSSIVGIGPLRGIRPIATLERFAVYCSCKQNISAAPPGAAQRARGIAQAVTGLVILLWVLEPSRKARRRRQLRFFKRSW